MRLVVSAQLCPLPLKVSLILPHCWRWAYNPEIKIDDFLILHGPDIVPWIEAILCYSCNVMLMLKDVCLLS